MRTFTVLKCSGVADKALEVVGLSEGIQIAEAVLVDETTRNAFPALQRVRQGFAGTERQEHVDVIGDDDVVGTRCVASVDSALAVEVMQAVGDDLGKAWILQGSVGTRCVASVTSSRCSSSSSENPPCQQSSVISSHGGEW